MPDNLDDDAFLAKANLTLNYKLYSAAVLLFATMPQSTIRSAYIQCVHYSGTDRAAGQDGREFTGPLISQLLEAMTFIENRIGKTETIRSGSVAAQPEYEFPMVCLRELLANALCHRDYLDGKRHTHIRVFLDKIEIVSPGRWVARSLPEGLELQLADLMSEPMSRNERLASALRCVRLVETQGSGIPTALTDCSERGAPPPTVMFADEMVKVTVFPRRDWSTTSIVRRRTAIDSHERNSDYPDEHGPNVTNSRRMQCEICYSDTVYGDHCEVCGALLPPTADNRSVGPERPVTIGEHTAHSGINPASRHMVSLQPATIHYTRALLHHDYAETVRIRGRGTSDVEILSIESNQPWLLPIATNIPFVLKSSKVEHTDSGLIDPTYSLTIICRPFDLRAGLHTGTVTINLRDHPPLSLNAAVDVIEPRPYDDYV